MTEPKTPVQEPDAVPTPFVARIAVGGIVIMLVSCGVATLLLGGALRGLGRHWAGFHAAPRTMGTVEQTMIEDAAPGLDLEAKQRAELERWEYVGDDEKHARIPIETAIDVMVRSRAKRGSAK